MQLSACPKLKQVQVMRMPSLPCHLQQLQCLAAHSMLECRLSILAAMESLTG